MQGKVEICGVNTATMPALKAAQTRALLERAHAGDAAALRRDVAGVAGSELPDRENVTR